MISELAAGVRYRFPIHRSDLVSALHENGKVISTTYEDDGVVVQAMLPRRLLGKFEEFEITEAMAS
jgi:50S ribosomal subunit-associated GTPase HflX